MKAFLLTLIFGVVQQSFAHHHVARTSADVDQELSMPCAACPPPIVDGPVYLEETACDRLVKLEQDYPELADLKIRFLKKFEEHFTPECGRGVEQILDWIIEVAQEMKQEYEDHKVEVPDDGTLIVGSVRGIPGIHFPNYTEVPITSFSCDGKKYVPGFYADLETGCQVFHVCYEHRMESFLCPIGTTFNQPILACDYWYSSNCSQSPIYHEVNDVYVEEEKTSDVEDMITAIIDVKKPDVTPPEDELKKLLEFLPIKAKVVHYKTMAAKADVKLAKAAVKGAKFAVKGAILKDAKLAVAKTAVKGAVVKDAKLAASVIAKAVKAAAAAEVKLAKTKVVATKAIPIVKGKVAIPVVKAKVATKLIPFTKVAAVKKAAISPMTKKALALGYMKLVKAKKLAIMG